MVDAVLNESFLLHICFIIVPFGVGCQLGWLMLSLIARRAKQKEKNIAGEKIKNNNKRQA